MELNFDDITLLCANKEKLHEQLVIWRLVPAVSTYKCKKCGAPLQLTENLRAIDGKSWYCKNMVSLQKQKRKACGYNVSYRFGTFFARSYLEIKQILEFVCLWVENASFRLTKRMIRISNHTFVDWSSFCREVVLNAFIEKKEKLGGIGVTVEIDESKFGKRKYHRGHHVEVQWIFGGYERGTGRIFMVAVEDRSRDTLLPIIRDWILPGTTIVSDFWKAYDCLASEGYEHLKVNHSLHFKDPVSGAHSNSIESSWRSAKASFSSSGRIKAHIPGNLAQYMFEKRCDQLGLDRAVEFLTLAASLYNSKGDIEPVDEAFDVEIDFE